MPSNFDFLNDIDDKLYDLGVKSEDYFADDPSTSVIKLRQFCEHLTKAYSKLLGYEPKEYSTQMSLLEKLKFDSKLPDNVLSHLHHVRKIGNDAVHNQDITNEHALTCLKMSVQLGFWYAKTTTDEFDFDDKVDFIPPKSPKQATKRLQDEINRLQRELLMAKRRVSERSSMDYMEAPTIPAPPAERMMSFMSFKTIDSKDRLTEILSKARRAARTTINLDAMMQEDTDARRITVHPWDDE